MAARPSSACRTTASAFPGKCCPGCSSCSRKRIGRWSARRVAWASASAPDVLLPDLGVPGLTGFEIARRIRRQPWGKTVALIAVTGWGQEQDRRRTTEAGFDAHLIKPVAEADLLSALGACVQTKR